MQLLIVMDIHKSKKFSGPLKRETRGIQETRELEKPGMSRDHFWSICTYPFSTNIGLNDQLLMPNLVDLVLL